MATPDTKWMYDNVDAYPDLVVEFEGDSEHQIKVHQGILCARSGCLARLAKDAELKNGVLTCVFDGDYEAADIFFRYVYGFEIPAHSKKSWGIWHSLYFIAVDYVELELMDKVWGHFAATAMEQTDASEVCSIFEVLSDWSSPEARDLESALHKQHAAKLH